MIYKLYDEQAIPFDSSDTYVIPGAGSGYTIDLKHAPSTARSPILSLTGTPSAAGAFSLVTYLPSESGEVFLDLEKSRLICHSSDAGIPITVAQKVAGTPVRANHMNEAYPWLCRTYNFNGIPQYQSVEDDGLGGWNWGFPLYSVYFPGGVASSVTVKRLSLTCQNVEAVVADPNFETRIGVSTVMRGRPNDFDSDGFMGNQYQEGVNGASVALNCAGFDNTDSDPTWYRNTAEVDLALDLSSGGVWLNIFSLDNRAQHSNVILDIGVI